VSTRVLSAEDVLSRAQDIMARGSFQATGWDVCLGLVVYEEALDYGAANVRMDLYVLGFERNGAVMPYFFVGSMCVNRTAWSILTQQQ